jgi:hypothetical protein
MVISSVNNRMGEGGRSLGEFGTCLCVGVVIGLAVMDTLMGNTSAAFGAARAARAATDAAFAVRLAAASPGITRIGTGLSIVGTAGAVGCMGRTDLPASRTTRSAGYVPA